MNALRLVIFCPDAWPMVTDHGLGILRWASALHQRGMQVTLVTCRWDRRLPARSECRELMLHRLLPPMNSPRRVVQWIDQANKWLSANERDFDLGIVFGNLDFVVQCGQRMRSKIPLIARIAETIVELKGTVARSSQSALRTFRRIVCSDTRAVHILASLGMANFLVQIGHPSWVSTDLPTTKKLRARKIFRQFANEFQVESDTQLIVSLGDLSAESGCEELIDASISLLNRDANIRVWISGFDRTGGQLAQRVRDHAWHNEILLVGPSDDIDDWLDAADLMIVPHQRSRESFIAPMVLGSGQPFLVSQGVSTSLSDLEVPRALTYEAGARGLATAIQDWLRDPTRVQQEASAFASKYHRSHQPTKILDDWTRLLTHCTIQRIGESHAEQ